MTFFHETAWPQLKSRPWIWGTFVWCFADFTSYWRHEGGMKGRNDKGLITYDRKIKKDAFYFYKANWSDEPMIHITGRRFVERTNALTEVKVYSNASDAELFVNGASKGVGKNDGNAVFVWKNVKLSVGENRIEARARCQEKEVSDDRTTGIANLARSSLAVTLQESKASSRNFHGRSASTQDHPRLLMRSVTGGSSFQSESSRRSISPIGSLVCS